MAVNRYLSSIPARTLSGRISSNLFSVVVDLHTSQEYNWGNVIGFNVVIISGSIIFFVLNCLSSHYGFVGGTKMRFCGVGEQNEITRE